MGGGVSIHDKTKSDAEKLLDETLQDKKKCDQLFSDIATCCTTGARAGNKFSISLQNAIDYYHSKHAIFSFVPDKQVIAEAHSFACLGKAKNFERKGMTMFLSSIYYFSHLWEVFKSVDDYIPDGKIFLTEFKAMQEHLNNVPGVAVEVPELTPEELEAEFKKIDKDHNNMITFSELCQYASKNIIKGGEFLEQELHNNGDNEEEVTEQKEEVKVDLGAVEGSCECGNVKFKVDLSKYVCAAICHCSSCRKATGGLFYAAHILQGGAVDFYEGKDDLKLRQPETTPGNIKITTNCCHTFVMLQQHDGSMDKIAAGHLPTVQFTPKMNIFCESAVVDVTKIGDCDKFLKLDSAKVSRTNEASAVAKAFTHFNKDGNGLSK